MSTHGVNTAQGEGEFVKVDRYGGVYAVSDRPMNVYGELGAIIATRREVYISGPDYRMSGPLKGHRVLGSTVGTPGEHLTSKVHVHPRRRPKEGL